MCPKYIRRIAILEDRMRYQVVKIARLEKMVVTNKVNGKLTKLKTNMPSVRIIGTK